MGDRTRWEYKHVELSWHSRSAGPPVGDLNRLGGDGWEMCGYLPFPPDASGTGKACGWAIFKRPKN